MFFKINVANKSVPGRLVIQYTPGQTIKSIGERKVKTRN